VKLFFSLNSNLLIVLDCWVMNLLEVIASMMAATSGCHCSMCGNRMQ